MSLFRYNPFFWQDVRSVIYIAITIVVALVALVLIGIGIYEVKGPTAVAWYILILCTAVLVGTSINYNTTWEENSRPSVYNYNNGSMVEKAKKVISTRSVLMDGEREKPPRAEFFGRLNGISTVKLGPYEEKFLNYYEFTHWKSQNARKEAIKAGIVNKSEENSTLNPDLATKSIYTT